MASITCYHCKGTHQSVAEVRACATVPAASPTVGGFTSRPAVTAGSRLATEKQVNFLRSLAARKQADSPATQTIIEDTDFEKLERGLASRMIDSLLRLKDKSAVVERREEMASRLPDVPAGWYAIDGTQGRETRFYRVDRPVKGRWAGRTFLKVQSSNEFWPITNRDEVLRVLLEIAVDPDAAGRRYGREIGRCCRCNRTLTDDESRAAGIGPVCAGR